MSSGRQPSSGSSKQAPEAADVPSSLDIVDDGPLARISPEDGAWSATRDALFTQRGRLRQSAARTLGTGDAACGGTEASGQGEGLKLEIDRRRLPRRVVQGGAMAVFASGRGAGQLARVELVDASWNGLGIKSPVLVEPGTSVSVIPEHAMSPRQIGVVVRCEKLEEGYRLGLLCRTQKAVA